MPLTPGVTRAVVEDGVSAEALPPPAAAGRALEAAATAATSAVATAATAATSVEQVRWLGPDRGRLVAEAGRAALIYFALLVIYGSLHPLTDGALVTIAVAAGVWLVALRTAAFAHPIVPVRAVAYGFGAVAGFVVVGVLDNMALRFDVPMRTGGLFTLAAFASVLVWDWAVEHTLDARRRVLVVGASGADELVAEELRTSRGAGFDLVGAVSVPDELTPVVEAQRPDIVVLTDAETYGEAVDRLLDAHARARVASLAGFFEYAFGRVPVDHITPAWFMSLLHPHQRIYTRVTKRAFDVVVALAGLVVAAPLLGVLALLTMLSRGPILYRQTRMGERGRPFTIYKLRSMRCDAEANGVVLACASDARATRLGCFLRRTHLDELPQLWNVLKGDMSIVGPRPERPELIERIEAAVPFWSRRLLVKPGITGWAQVRAGYASDEEAMKTKLSYDLWYLRHQSLFVDIAVCAMTFLPFLGRPSRS